MLKVSLHASPEKKVARRTAFVALLVSVLMLQGACSVPKVHYAEPQSALNAAKTAVQEDRKLHFISAMSRETLDEHAQKIEFGWSEIRTHFAFFGSEMTIVEDDVYDPIYKADAPEDADPMFVWPQQDNAQAVRRLRVAFTYEGEDFEEDLLFVQEVDDQEANTETSAWIRVGEQWFLRDRHPNPERYRKAGRTLEERTNWRLVYPYLPFHAESKLAQRVIESLNKRG